MRILVTTDLIGGVWTFTRELTRELLRQGHCVALMTLHRKPARAHAAWCSQMAELNPSRFEYTNCNVPLEWMEQNESAYIGAERKLLELATSFAPDVIHSNQFCFGGLPIAIPKLITAHSDVFTWAKACRPQGLAASPWLDRYCAHVQHGLEGADAIVAPTRWMLDALGDQRTLPPIRSVILNGRTLPLQRDVELRAMQAVTAGRLWDESKNLQLLGLIESPFPILVAGERAHETHRIVLPVERVAHVGTLCERDLLRLFGRSALYIAPSRYEPFGLAPLEAALCGCAIIANDIPSLREVWGDAALYFKHNDADSLAELLRLLHCSSERLKAAQHHSGVRARQLSAKRMAKAYLKLYTALTTPSKPQSIAHLPAEEHAAFAL